MCHRIANQCTGECIAKNKYENDRAKDKQCKRQCNSGKNTCKAACIGCNDTPSISGPVVATTTSLAFTPEVGHTDSTAAFIGGGAIAVALLAFLYFASRCVPFAPVYIPRALVGPCLPVLPSSPATANAAIGVEQAVDKGLRQRRRREGIWIGKQLAVNHGEPGTALYHLRFSCQRVDCHRIIRSFVSDKCRQ